MSTTTTTKRAGGEKRGKASDRRKSKHNLLHHHGDGATAPCTWCGTPLTFETIERDRIVPGGPYRMVNLVPACRRCNLERSDKSVAEYLPLARDPERAVAMIEAAATYRPRR
jgi:NAD-dependent SIR2 family protein deacetylase